MRLLTFVLVLTVLGCSSDDGRLPNGHAIDPAVSHAAPVRIHVSAIDTATGYLRLSVQVVSQDEDTLEFISSSCYPEEFFVLEQGDDISVFDAIHNCEVSYAILVRLPPRETSTIMLHTSFALSTAQEQKARVGMHLIAPIRSADQDPPEMVQVYERTNHGDWPVPFVHWDPTALLDDGNIVWSDPFRL